MMGAPQPLAWWTQCSTTSSLHSQTHATCARQHVPLNRSGKKLSHKSIGRQQRKEGTMFIVEKSKAVIFCEDVLLLHEFRHCLSERQKYLP